MGSTTGQIKVLNNLIDRGWIPLRQLGILLGYKDARAVYTRQKGPRKVPTVRIGGVDRVYADAVLESLEKARYEREDECATIIHLYHVGMRNKARRERDRDEVVRDLGSQEREHDHNHEEVEEEL